MKKIVLIVFAALAVANGKAQSIYDAVNIASKDLDGTARFVGMGGAMGALGGDISTIGTNPAGIGIYRSNDVMGTFGYSLTGTESNYVGNKFEMNKARWNLDNLGFVVSTKVGNETALRFVNFGFNYHKTKSFYKNMTMEGLMGVYKVKQGTKEIEIPVSQARYMAQQATNNQEYVYSHGAPTINFGASDIFNNSDAGWLGAMGYQGWLMDEMGQDPYYYTPIIPSEAYGYFLSRESGGIDQYDFNIAFNIRDRFYFGFTIGAYNVDYNKYSVYDESYIKDEGYALESFNRIHGGGFDVKFGAILRPFEESPFRIGLAIHTPTFYKLTYTTGALLTSDVLVKNHETGQETMERHIVDTYQALDGRDMDRDFDLQTPWVFNASLGYTVGNYLALGAEYEYEDYSSMKFKYREGDMMWEETNEVKGNLKGVHTLRLGAEWKPVSAFALRAGYNFSTAAFKEEAIKAYPDNSINTDTDFANSKTMNTFTLGIGYRWKMLYADLAYKFQTYKSDFYPFYNQFSTDASTDYMVTASSTEVWTITPPATKVTNTRSQVLLTLGVRF